MKQIFILILSFTAYLSPLAAQGTLKGKVTDASGEALIGVSISERGTSNGTISGTDGSYTLKITRSSANILFSYTGYEAQTIAYTGQAMLDVVLLEGNNTLDQIVVVGSRRAGRTKAETPVPVDVISPAQVQIPSAKMDITSALNAAAPSFNYNKQTGSDGADHIDLATLRGLGPDQTLVLVNGKRRHQTAFVSVFGTRGRGNSGTDLNAISGASIDRVEILRDGASAQYGSDAIAGVINIITRSSVKKLSGNIGFSGYNDPDYNSANAKDPSQYYTGSKFDGQTFNAGLNYGLPLGSKGGFVNISADYTTAGKTYRQEIAEKEIPYPNYVRRAFGDGSMTGGGAFLNAELPVNDNVTAYAFGGANLKNSDAFAYTRNFSGRPERFVTDANGNIVDPNNIVQEIADGSDQYYNPHIQTEIQDYSGAVGVRGGKEGGWKWDLSNTSGYNNFHFFGDKTFNASTGDGNKNHFDDGGFSFLQNTTNLNFSKPIEGIASGFNLAFGAEYRFENYQLYAGEDASWKTVNQILDRIETDSVFDANGTFVNIDSTFIYKAPGAQGFPGYQPGDEVDATRSVIGGYVDAEIDITEKFLVGAALRFENYSDFGSTFNGKLAARLKLAENFNVRGSVSTGYRAPSLQQLNFSSTFTTVQGANIFEVKIAPNESPITKAAGIEPLKQERSVNASLGFTARPAEGLTVTVDGYMVQVKDRVVLSGQFSADDSSLSPDFTNALKQLNVASAQFFANAVNTTNMGVDVVIDYSKRIGSNQHFKALLAANFQDMKIDKINVPARLNNSEYFLSTREQAFILASAPNQKGTLNLEYGVGKFALGTRATLFGKITLQGYGEDGLGQNPTVPKDDGTGSLPDVYEYGAKVVNDWYVSYKLGKGIQIFAGADNLWGVHPDIAVVKGAEGWAFNCETGGPWDAVQMGGNGRRLFARAVLNF
ncbi:MAG: TonB-dependent receptor domain-containing protein [Saprospiraceae bacterium]